MRLPLFASIFIRINSRGHQKRIVAGDATEIHWTPIYKGLGDQSGLHFFSRLPLKQTRNIFSEKNMKIIVKNILVGYQCAVVGLTFELLLLFRRGLCYIFEVT